MPFESAPPPILDVRSEAQFLAGHFAGAVNIPLEQLAGRVHELSAPDDPLIVFDEHPTRARWAASRLRARGRTVAGTRHGRQWLREEPLETGPGRARLWRPHAFLQESLVRIRAVWPGFAGRTALDLACGSGRDAVALAEAGFNVEAWDRDAEALRRCDDLARRHQAAVRTRLRDVEADPDLGADRFELIACFSYLHRPLMPFLARAVVPGGFVVYETFTVRQRELFGKPRREAFLLQPDELGGYFDGWEIWAQREGLAGPRRHVASLLARRRFTRPDGDRSAGR